jgi:hypothetical protein
MTDNLPDMIGPATLTSRMWVVGTTNVKGVVGSATYDIPDVAGSAPAKPGV